MALFIQRIMLGEDMATFSTVLTPREALHFNMATARAIEVSPPWRIMGEAELVGFEASLASGRQLTLVGVLNEVLQMRAFKAGRFQVLSSLAKRVG